MISKIKSLIKRAVVSLSLDDTKNYPVTQIDYLGKTSEIEVVYPYGSFGRLPKDALVLCFNVEGNEENKAGIGNTPTIRFKDLEIGECGAGNPLTGSKIHFKANGDIEVVGKNNKIVTIDADMNLTVGGDMNIDVAGGSTINITGDVNLTSSGSINIDASTATKITAPAVSVGASGGTLRKLIDERIIASYNAHTHGGIATGVGVSGVPSTLLVAGSQETADMKAS